MHCDTLLLLHLGLISIDDELAMKLLLMVLDSMWKLLFAIFDRGGVQVDERRAVELIDSLLLLLNPKHEHTKNSVRKKVAILWPSCLILLVYM